MNADEILVLDHGQIIERGKHGELLAANSHYAAMWRLQLQAAEVGDLATVDALASPAST